MAIYQFPEVEQADVNGLLAVGGDLEIESLLLAYRSGIFPWPISKQYPIAWFSPNPRGVLRIKDLHISRSMQKTLKQKNYSASTNKLFDEVLYNCAYAKNRKDQKGTWITPEIMSAYSNLHKNKFAYSIEIYQQSQMIGGLYGVKIGSFVCGESMFFLEKNGSKLALSLLLGILKSMNIHWIDTQMVTPILSNFGAIEISRKDFQSELSLVIDKAPSSDILSQTKSYTSDECYNYIQYFLG